jgi:hypothetical protein
MPLPLVSVPVSYEFMLASVLSLLSVSYLFLCLSLFVPLPYVSPSCLSYLQYVSMSLSLSYVSPCLLPMSLCPYLSPMSLHVSYLCLYVLISLLCLSISLPYVSMSLLPSYISAPSHGQAMPTCPGVGCNLVYQYPVGILPSELIFINTICCSIAIN